MHSCDYRQDDVQPDKQSTRLDGKACLIADQLNQGWPAGIYLAKTKFH